MRSSLIFTHGDPHGWLVGGVLWEDKDQKKRGKKNKFRLITGDAEWKKKDQKKKNKKKKLKEKEEKKKKKAVVYT